MNMKIKLNWKLIAALAGLNLAFSSLAASDDELNQLKQQIQELDQKVRILEREREIDQDSASTAAKAAPRIIIGGSGFNFSSGDSNFTAQIHGLVQFDSRTFFEDGGINGNDGFLLRRARPILTGTLFHDFDYNFTPDFGGNTVQIQDAYLNYRYNQQFQLQAGKFKSPVGLEQLQSDPATSFNERSLVTDLVPNRDLGLDLHGDFDLFSGGVSYAIGVFNGATDYSGTTTNASFQDGKALVARLFFQPWKNSGLNGLRGFGFGVAGSLQSDHTSATNVATDLSPGYTSDGQQKFFTYSPTVIADGQHWRLSPQAYYYYGPFGLLAEYVVSDQHVRKGIGPNTPNRDLQNTAWELSGSWLLTGEDASYTGITPRHPFDPRNGQWGAWQVVARYAELNLDNGAFFNSVFADPTKSASGAQAWSVGLNWYLNRNLRANLSFSRTTFSGFTGKVAPGVVPAQAENVLFSRLQLAF
jgi:phosphate-selective porin OprO/OprP